MGVILSSGAPTCSQWERTSIPRPSGATLVTRLRFLAPLALASVAFGSACQQSPAPPGDAPSLVVLLAVDHTTLDGRSLEELLAR